MLKHNDILHTNAQFNPIELINDWMKEFTSVKDVPSFKAV